MGAKNIISLIILGVIINYNSIYGQNIGVVKVIVNPSSAIIKLDTAYLKSNVPFKIEPGTYTLKMWAPKRQLYEQEIIVVKDTSIRILKTLAAAGEYVKYTRDLKRYRINRFASRFIPVTLLVSLTAFNIKRQNNLSDEADLNYNNAIEAQVYYNEAVYLDEIKIYKNRFNDKKEAYEASISSFSKARVITYGTITIGALVSWHFFKVARRLVKPTYESKTLLSNLNFNYQKSNGFDYFALSYNF